MTDSLNGNRSERFEVIEYRQIHLAEQNDSALVIYVTRQLAARAGFSTADEAMIATAASELATNIVRYAQTGDINITILKHLDTGKSGIELYACDQGPGIQDIEAALQEQFTTTRSSLGLGLPSVKRIMDEFFIESEIGKGTRVLARKWKVK